MIPRNRTDEVLRDLLRSRRAPVDEERLEAIRTGLSLRRGTRGLRQAPGFLSRHRAALSFATAAVLIGVALWTVPGLRHEPTGTPVAPWLLEIVQEEGRVDQALALLGEFAATPSVEGAVAQWDPFSRSLLGQYQAEVLMQAFYDLI